MWTLPLLPSQLWRPPIVDYSIMEKEDIERQMKYKYEREMTEAILMPSLICDIVDDIKGTQE